MNSGAPASIAPPPWSSAGMMVWQSACKVLYWGALKYFGLYVPEAACSAWIILCAYSAACAGITLSTEPATTPAVRVFRMSRRVTELDGITVFRLEVPFRCLVQQIF